MKRVIAAVVFGLCAICAPSLVHAQVGPTLNHCLVTWGASPSTDVVSYTIYSSSTAGNSGLPPSQATGTAVGTVSAPVLSWGSLTTCSMPEGQKYVTVTAKDAAGNESVRSNEFPFVLDLTAPGAANNVKVTMAPSLLQTRE